MAVAYLLKTSRGHLRLLRGGVLLLARSSADAVGGPARPATETHQGRPLHALLAQIRREEIERRRVEAAALVEAAQVAEIERVAVAPGAEATAPVHDALSAPIPFDAVETVRAIEREDYTDIMWVLLMAA